MEIFLSHTFKDEDAELVARLESLLSSHDVRIITGRRLSGQPLTAEVMRLIERSHALIAVMTRRETIGNPADNRWMTHPWVVAELNHARAASIPAIALVQDGVELSGPYQEHERIDFTEPGLIDAFLALSETVRLWKEQRGRIRMAHLLPDSVGQQLRANNALVCRYRFVSHGDPDPPWREAKPFPGLGGTILYLSGATDEAAQLQIEIVEHGTPRWWSELTPQSIRVEMNRMEEQP